MVSTQDIFGLAVGMFYALVAPIAAYFLLRTFATLRARDIALGVLGFIAIVALNQTLLRPVAFALARLVESDSRFQTAFWGLVLPEAFSRSAFAFSNEAACFLLLSYFATRREGLGPGFAYALGAGAAYCLMTANREFHELRLALVINEYGAYATFGISATDSENFLAVAFAYGIPMGAGAVFRFLIEIVLAHLV
jgi:hypothetical protein